MNDRFQITTEEQLEAILGEPSELVKQKIATELGDAMQEFVRRSPLLFMSTLDDKNQADVSPKGDAPGFVKIDNDHNLLIPDRPGNKLIYGFRNILRNNSVGLIFVVPNMRETLRVKGRATLTKDPELLGKLSAQGKPALLCTHVTVDECFFHCGKAMIRSKMWKPDAWTKYKDSLLALQVANKFDVSKSEVEERLEQSYRDQLY